MQPELRYESLFFYTRNELEHLQPLSQTLCDMIRRSSKVLALRPIDLVEMDCDAFGSKDNIKIFVTNDDDDGDYEASIHDGDFAETFRRLQHACIKEFCVEIRDSPFLRYWKAQGTAVFTVESIDFDLTDDTDYGVLDSTVNHLRPRTMGVSVEESSWHENGSNSVGLELLARDSLLNSLQTCDLHVSLWTCFSSSSFFVNEPGYPNYKLWCNDSNVADGIDRFIEGRRGACCVKTVLVDEDSKTFLKSEDEPENELFSASFVRNGCANVKLESVGIGWHDGAGPQSSSPKQLRKPTKTDMPLPKNDMTEWLTRGVHRVSQCEMHCFVNMNQWMRLDVYKWTLEYDRPDRLATRNYIFCRVTDF